MVAIAICSAKTLRPKKKPTFCGAAAFLHAWSVLLPLNILFSGIDIKDVVGLLCGSQGSPILTNCLNHHG